LGKKVFDKKRKKVCVGFRVVYFFLKNKKQRTIATIMAIVAQIIAYSTVLFVPLSGPSVTVPSATVKYVVAKELSYELSPQKVAVIVYSPAISGFHAYPKVPLYPSDVTVAM